MEPFILFFFGRTCMKCGEKWALYMDSNDFESYHAWALEFRAHEFICTYKRELIV